MTAVSVTVDQAKALIDECRDALEAIKKGDRIPNECSTQELYETLQRACNKIVSDSQTIQTLTESLGE